MNSTIKNSKYRSNCSEKETLNNGFKKYTENNAITKKDTPENSVELCVEVEMTDSIRNLLSSPEKCNSTLLDVTVIKPQELGPLQRVETNTLKVFQVKNLINKLNKQKLEKKLINDILEDKSPSNETIIKIVKHNPKRWMQTSSDLRYDNLIKDKMNPKNKLQKVQKHRNNMSSSAPVDTYDKARMYNNNYCYVPMPQPPEGVCQIRASLRNIDAMVTHVKEVNYHSVTEDANSEECFRNRVSVHNFRCGDHKKTHQVYAAPRTTYKDLNSIITCQSMSKDTGTPCMCEHCGIACLLSETQKRPIITAPAEHVSDLRNRNKPKTKDFNKHEYRMPRRKIPDANALIDDKSIPVCYAHLVERVKILEERMDIQEERAVPKDYFKRIITKIISHFSPRLSCKHENFPIRDSDSNSYETETRYKKNYSVNPLFTNDSGLKGSRDKEKHNENMKKLLTNLAGNLPENKKNEFAEQFWKWGGEVLKPGIDLKNKILSLLDLTIQNTEKTKENTEVEKHPVSKFDEAKKSNHPSLGNMTEETKDFNSEAFKNFVEAMSAKIYNTHKKSLILGGNKTKNEESAESNTLSDSTIYKKKKKSENTSKKSRIPKPFRQNKSSNKNTSPDGNKKLNVSYLNPKLSTWQEEESQISFRLEFSDAESVNSRNKDSKTKGLEKMEFLKTLSRTKDSDKEKLWESIWSQAKANGQTRQDRVTIQLPKKNDGSQYSDMIEIEFSIGEIEYMLTKHKYQKQESFVRENKKSKS